MRWSWEWVLLTTVVTACAPVDSRIERPGTPWYRTVPEPMPSDSDRVIRFYDRLLAMKGNELAGELEVTRKSFEKDKSELNRMQLALLVSLPGTTFRDDSAALTLLGPFVKDKGQDGSTLRPLAIWLHSELLELRRIDETMQLQAAKLKEELRHSDEALQQQTIKLKDEQRRTEALQQKLDAILDLEMKMIEREQNLPKKK